MNDHSEYIRYFFLHSDKWLYADRIDNSLVSDSTLSLIYFVRHTFLFLSFLNSMATYIFLLGR